MEKVRTIDFGENFIEALAGYVDEWRAHSKGDLSRLAIVFGGKRPGLFVKRQLSRKIKTAFYPPVFFSMDEFVSYVSRKKENFLLGHELDQCYLLYQLTKTYAPHILAGREAFARFLPWAREILSFIDHADLENISDDKLRDIGLNAQVGYAVLPEVNRLLQSIVLLRGAYHASMRQSRNFSRGFLYRFASESSVSCEFPEFEQIIFCNFFYFHNTEGILVKNLYDRNLASFVFQGEEERWPTLKKASQLLGQPIAEKSGGISREFTLKLYSVFDGHSQAATVREILKKIDQPSKTVIVLPDAQNIIPLLSEIAPLAGEFNISMGYPLKRSSLYSLLDFIFKAQVSRDISGYYSRDFLRVLRHPLVKNLDFGAGSGALRVVIHKIEEMLTGMDPGVLTGSLFIDPRQLLDLDEIFLRARAAFPGMGVTAEILELKNSLSSVFENVFFQWEEVSSFERFSLCLEKTLALLLEKSFLSAYPLNLKIAERMVLLKETMQSLGFRHENFAAEDIFRIFASQMEREIVAFSGSPLKGLQILGLFETRSLSFDNVIVLDANEGVLPKLNVYEPFIPREVMLSLGLDRLEQEEEIQRYQFMRLISSAKEVHLVYEENSQKEKSRFVEELVWEEQKKKSRLDAVPVVFPSFSAKVLPHRQRILKTPPMISFLKSYRYSASSINTYLRSPVEFYYSYVLGLRPKENRLEEAENRQVGVFVHDLLEQTFKDFIGKKPVIDEKFKSYFKKVLDERFSASFGKGRRSDVFLLRKVIDARLDRFLQKEASASRQVKQVLYIEKKFEDKITLSCGQINFVYRVDRVDELEDGTIMILDYKTGSIDPMPKAIQQIEALELSRENIRDMVVSFQIPLYFHYLDKTFKGQKINAAYYNLRTLELSSFIDHKMPFENARINSAFLRPLDFVMSEILDPKVPFEDRA